jgi:hypothetical protein
VRISSTEAMSADIREGRISAEVTKNDHRQTGGQ